MSTIKSGNIYDKTIRKYDSDAITITPDLDFTGWTLKYMVKERLTDADANAVLSITPTLVTDGDFKKIVISFTPTDTQGISIGQYKHALKVVLDNTAITLFIGTFTIIDDYINYPVE